MDSLKEEGRGKKEEGRRKKEEGRRKKKTSPSSRSSPFSRSSPIPNPQSPIPSPQSPLPITFGMNVADRLSPNHGFDFIVINQTNTVGILPQDFTRKEFATEEFNLNVGFVFNVGLNEANTR
jgi:hypothetical protein